MTKVKLYSILRELSGTNEIEINIGRPLKVSQLLDMVSAGSEGFRRALELIGWRVQVVADGRSLGPDDLIHPGISVIHLLPPSAGGATNIHVAVLKGSDTVDLNSVVSKLYNSDLGVGAVAIFVGIVRGINRGERVDSLYYEYAEELLEQKLRELAEEATKKFALSGAVIYHYVGIRRPGELTMVVGVSGPSRNNVFPALEWLVNKVKHEAPIWKEELRESGRYFMLGDAEVRA